MDRAGSGPEAAEAEGGDAGPHGAYRPTFPNACVTAARDTPMARASAARDGYAPEVNSSPHSRALFPTGSRGV